MPTKVQQYTEMADCAVVHITSNIQNWIAFLKTSGRMYKYRFDDQLMIHIQRPRATACAEYDVWDKRLHRYVRRGAKRLKIKIDAETQRNFRLAYERVMSHLDYQSDGLQIVYPNNPEEIVREGQALHHCVGGYVDRVARKECLILFLRHCDDLATPYYTVEVRERKAVQVRGMKNADPTPEVQRFINSWEKQVLQAA